MMSFVNLSLHRLFRLLSTARELINILLLKRFDVVPFESTRRLADIIVRFLRKNKMVILTESALVLCLRVYRYTRFSSAT